MDGLTAISKRDAWTVGTAGYRRQKTIVLHWTGTRWRSVQPPAPEGFLPFDVISSAADDVWILGHTGRFGEALRFTGRWSTVPLPAHWRDGHFAVLSASNAWMGIPECPATGQDKNCSSTLQHWNGVKWSPQHVKFMITGLADAAGRAWILGLTGIRVRTPHQLTGRLVVFRSVRGRWQQVPVPSPQVTDDPVVLPQITGAPDGDVWLLQSVPARKTSRGTLYHWNGARWALIAEPASADGRSMSGDGLLSYDGNDGIWAGLAHWTGRQWVNVYRVGPGPAYQTFLGPAAGIPGSGSSWAVGGTGGFIGTVPSGPGVIAVNGPLPG